MEILEKAQEMLEKYPLCNHCLGRQFALLGYNIDNQKRGDAIKLLLTLKGHQLSFFQKKVRRSKINLLKIMAVNGSFDMAVEILRKKKKKIIEKKECYLCSGRFKVLLELVSDSLEKLKEYEYSTFLVGIDLPTDIEEMEDEFKAEFAVINGESMRNEISREVGKHISRITKKMVDYKRPDIVLLLNPFSQYVQIKSNPLFVAGRYRKMVRGIPQSKWICTLCSGKGCQKCDWTGKTYLESVEEIIAGPVLEASLGVGVSFHAAGREDVDALMLGRGRPFVIEIKDPKRRFINLKDLEQKINVQARGKVGVSGLIFAKKDTVRKVKKKEATEKLYRAIVEFDRTVFDEELELLQTELTDIKVQQQTPLRVLHRRADRVREKHIYMAKIKRITPNRAEITIKCQGGLYIKELISGDNGRTDPSVAKLLNVSAIPLELDVLDVV